MTQIIFTVSGTFCSTPGIPDILVTSGCVELVLECMKQHRNNPEFQVKGLLLLKSLVQNADNVFSVVVRAIKKAMETYPTSAELQKRCCEIMYDLARDDYELSMKLIKSRFHKVFFKILEDFTDDESAVLNIAADCIYLLACEHDLKNEMLFEMCALGNTTAVSLLIQLSADVNYTQGGRTPLTVACQANNLQLVQLLLEKGVSDMHHPLTLCLEDKRLHKLAGFILKRMGHDEDGGSISLAGLKLTTLRTEWLAPALLGSEKYSSHIALTRWLNLIRKSRHRLSISTLGSTHEADEDIITELSATDVSVPEDMTSEADSSGVETTRDNHSVDNLRNSTYDQAESNPLVEGREESQSWVDSNIPLDYPQQRSRRRSDCRLAESVSDSHLMTVAELSDFILPERRESLNDAFLEKSNVSPRTRGFSYSCESSFSTSELLDMSMSAEASSKKKHLPRSKSNSLIEGDVMIPAASAGKNPVR